MGVALAVGLFTVATAALDGHPHPSDELGADGEEVVVTWQGQDCEFVDRDSTVVRAVGPQVQVALWAVRDPAMGCGAAEERTTRLPLPGGLGDRQLVDVACTGSETRHAHC